MASSVRLTLAAFEQDDFTVTSLLDGLAEPLLGCGGNDLPIGDLQSAFEGALESLTKLQIDVEGQIHNLAHQNEKFGDRYRGAVTDQRAAQSELSQNFKRLDRRFRAAASTAMRVGDRLSGTDHERDRARHAEQLLRLLRHLHDPNEALPRVRSPQQAAVLQREMWLLTHELTIPDFQQVVKRIEQWGETILAELLEEFDNAADRNDAQGMRCAADAVLDCFRQNSGALFNRFVFQSLKPLTASRQRTGSASLVGLNKPSYGMRETLSVAFRQVLGLVQERHKTVRKVFPRAQDEVMSLLVTRLFNDAAYGLQPLLESFLRPRSALKPEEYLELLSVAYRLTAKLVSELVHGVLVDPVSKDSAASVSCSSTSLPSGSSEPNEGLSVRSRLPSYNETISKVESDCVSPHRSSSVRKRVSSYESFRGLGSAAANLRDSLAEKRPTFQFGSDFLRLQMRSLFRQFTADYLQRELTLFDARTSTLFYSALPHALVNADNPDLAPLQNHRIAEFGSAADESERLTLDDIERACDAALPRDASNDGSENGLDIASRVLHTDALPMRLVDWSAEAHARCLLILGRCKTCTESDTVERTVDSSHTSREVHIRRNSADEAEAEEEAEMASGICRIFCTLCDRLCGGLLIELMRSIEAELPPSPNVTGEHHTESFDQVMKNTKTRLLGDHHLVGHHEIDQQNTDSESGYSRVVGEDTKWPSVRGPPRLPALAGRNPTVKALASGLHRAIEMGNLKDDSTFVSPQIDLFFKLISRVEAAVGVLVKHWTSAVRPSLANLPNSSSACLFHLQKKLAPLEQCIAAAVARCSAHAVGLMQAVVITLQNKSDFRPKNDLDDEAHILSYSEPTSACRACLRVYRHHARLLIQGLNGSLSTRDAAMLRLGLELRDLVLANISRFHVSMKGAFSLMRDVDMLCSSVIDESKTLSTVVRVDIERAMMELRALINIFIVQPEHLADVMEEGLLGTAAAQLRYALVGRRSDFSTGLGITAGWARALRQKLLE